MMVMVQWLHGQESVLDLTLVSEDMAGKSTREVMKESAIGSDTILYYWNKGTDNRKRYPDGI